jgi:hypothetical protein
MLGRIAEKESLSTAIKDTVPTIHCPHNTGV